MTRRCGSGRCVARTAIVGLLSLVLGLLGAGPVAAEPVPSAGEVAAVASWPVELQELIAGTAAFRSGPWFSAAGCTDRGGDVGVYINTFFEREAAFRDQLRATLAAGDADAAGLLAAAGPGDVFPNGDRAFRLRTGVCAADLLAWISPDPESPWGFRWASRPDEASLERMRQQAPTEHGGVLDPLSVCTDPGSYACSRAFFVNCDQAAEVDRQRCLDWNIGVQQHLSGLSNWVAANTGVLERVGQFLAGVGVGFWAGGAWAVDALGWVLGKAGEAVGWLAKKGMEQVVAFFTQGAVDLWGMVTGFLVEFESADLAGGGFVATYNLVSGLMLALAFLVWLAGLAVAWRRGRLAGSVGGAVRAVIGIQAVGAVAWLMLQLANEATAALISAQQRQLGSADFTVSLIQVNPVVGLLAAVLAVLGMLGTALILLFQAPLVLGHALFGPTAAVGQAHPATEHWLGRWFIRLLSLCWCKFFMVALMILAQNLLASTSANAARSLGQQLFSVLSGLLLMLLLPTTPWLLSAVMSFTVGHASAAADRMGQRLTAAAGAAAMHAAPAAAGAGVMQARATTGALATMGSNLRALSALGDGSFGGGGASAGGGSPSSAGGAGSPGSLSGGGRLPVGDGGGAGSAGRAAASTGAGSSPAGGRRAAAIGAPDAATVTGSPVGGGGGTGPSDRSAGGDPGGQTDSPASSVGVAAGSAAGSAVSSGPLTDTAAGGQESGAAQRSAGPPRTAPPRSNGRGERWSG